MTKGGLLGPNTDLLPLPAQFDDPFLNTVMQHWQDIRQGQNIPQRSALDPTAFRRCLPHVWIYGYLPEEDDFVCRLAGAEVNYAWGYSIMGKRISELYGPENSIKLKSRWKFVLEKPAIMHSKFTTLRETTSFKRAERLTLPVADQSGEPAFIFGVTHYRFDKIRDRDKQIAPPEEKPIYYSID
ncbi:PAS domain-containing protein [Aestuariispira ectoiniformans]|uniref:PAS domain-containing protein n=1 Tax=Aestuariispira ectoiniformans TaxID=2775080 RepID=UPI00223B5C12|nr:PAS domain-containing protein [Aestuariispira ectoiniformans]